MGGATPSPPPQTLIKACTGSGQTGTMRDARDWDIDSPPVSSRADVSPRMSVGNRPSLAGKDEILEGPVSLLAVQDMIASLEEVSTSIDHHTFHMR